MRGAAIPAFTVLLLMAGDAAAQGAARKAKGCLTPSYSFENEDADAREAACLRELRAVASRDGDRLTLRFQNGATKTLQNYSCDEDKFAETTAAREKAGEPVAWHHFCVTNSLVGYRPIARIFVIVTSFYEGGTFTLISARTGKSLEMHGVPHFSPDESMFLAIDNADAYTGDEDLVLGTTADDAPTVIWQHRREGNLKWSLDKWIDVNRIALGSVSNDQKCNGQDCTFMLERQGREWVLQPTSPQ